MALLLASSTLIFRFLLLSFVWVTQTVIHFMWVGAKFGTSTIVNVNGTLVESKMCTFTLESMHFIFNKCPICTYDCASAKFSTNSHETDYSAVAELTKTHTRQFCKYNDIGSDLLSMDLFSYHSWWNTRCVSLHCKKSLAVFPSPAGISIANLNYSRPGRVWQLTSRLGTRKPLFFFYSVVDWDQKSIQIFCFMGEISCFFISPTFAPINSFMNHR